MAWGWLEGPGELTLQVDPHHPGLADEVLARAQQAGPGPICTTISGNESHIAAALTARGYRAATDGPFFRLPRQRPDDPPAGDVPPDGYILRLCDDASTATRAEAHRAAWCSWNST